MSPGAALRAGAEMTSEHLGDDVVGQIVTALEETVNSAGTVACAAIVGGQRRVENWRLILEPAGTEEDCSAELHAADYPMLLLCAGVRALLAPIAARERGGEQVAYVQALSQLILAGAIDTDSWRRPSSRSQNLS